MDLDASIKKFTLAGPAIKFVEDNRNDLQAMLDDWRLGRPDKVAYKPPVPQTGAPPVPVDAAKTVMNDASDKAKTTMNTAADDAKTTMNEAAGVAAGDKA